MSAVAIGSIVGVIAIIIGILSIDARNHERDDMADILKWIAIILGVVWLIAVTF